jgi:hypothetical protein
MNRSALLLGLSAGLLLAAGTASAGTCSAEIEALQKTIAATGTVASADSTSVPQGAAGALAANAGGSAAPVPVPAPNGTDAQGGMVANASPGAGSSSGIAPGKIEDPKSSGGTLAAANSGAGGAPAQTAPLDSDAPQSGAPQSAAAIDPDAASQSLARARLFDQAGDESACMMEVNQAKSQLGQQ